MKLHLNLSDINLTNQSSRPSTNHRVTNRTILKKQLDINIIQSCLDSLDVFRDLLEGIPLQKNRVVRDVCKNIQVKYYQQGEVIYNVGDKAEAVYFCIHGLVSICILQDVPKEQLAQQTQFATTNSKIKPNDLKMSINLSTNPSYSVSSISLNEQQQQFQTIQEEIDLVEQGEGFGQAQFIAETKRKLKAVAKQDQTLIGKLQIDHFAEVLQNYKQRVYYKKRDMFQKCPLFANMSINKLQFIINNTKPMTLHISNKLVKQGSKVDLIYLVNKGQISLWKTGIQINKQRQSEEEDEEETADDKQSPRNKRSLSPNKFKQNQSVTPRNNFSNSILQSLPKKFSSALKHRLEKPALVPQQNKNKVFMGLMSEGCFIGDMQLAMGLPFQFNAICRTEKAELYHCDRRIILSQMTEQDLAKASASYKQKQSYIHQKIYKYKTAKQCIERRRDKQMLPPLTKQQIKIKRKLMHRHTQQKPSLIGHCSPRDIQKMIARKQVRVIKQPQNSKYPVMQLYANHSVKKRSSTPNSPCSFTPLTLVNVPGTKCITEPDVYQSPRKKQSENPEGNTYQQMKKFQSMLIQLKPIKTNFKNLQSQRQKNMVVVGKILGKYRKCDSRLKSMEDIIQKIQQSRV